MCNGARSDFNTRMLVDAWRCHLLTLLVAVLVTAHCAFYLGMAFELALRLLVNLVISVHCGGGVMLECL